MSENECSLKGLTPRARRSKSAMRARVSSTASTSVSSVNRRCEISKRVGWPAPQWSAINDPADHSVQMVRYTEAIANLLPLTARRLRWESDQFQPEGHH